MKNKHLNLIIQTLRNPWWLKNGQTKISHILVKKFTEFCCNYLPKNIRKHVFKIIDTSVIIGSRLISLLYNFYLTEYLVYGREKHSGKKIIIILLCQEDSFSYLLKLIFSRVDKCEKNGKINILKIKNKYKRLPLEIDAIFFKCDRFYSNYLQKNHLTVIPELITVILDISKPFDKIYKKFRKRILESSILMQYGCEEICRG